MAKYQSKKEDILHEEEPIYRPTRETELVLVQPQIDRNARTEIFRAVETARSMPVTGHDRERTGKTIEKATKLITDVLENNPVEVKELPGQLQAGSRKS